MKYVFIAVLLAVAPSLYAADDTSLAEAYFSKTNPVLTPQEKASLAVAQKWQAKNAATPAPIAGKNGTVQFLFGSSQVSIVCAPLQVCDFELQPNETINDYQLGDTVRWLVTPSLSGTGSSETTHLIIKTMDVGLETTLIVMTDRRTYRLKLRSHRTEYIPAFSFVYPEETQAKWDAYKRRQSQEKEVATIPQTGEYLGDLTFDYDVDGKAPWKPVRVYNDGVKTIIEMPDAMAQTEAPTLLVVRKEGGLFSDDETVMVNYRIQGVRGDERHGRRFIVDSVFDKAILIAGVGSSQDRITITRRK